MIVVYLKVFYICKEVVVKDIKYFDYNGGFLRLIFVEKGWIILFKVFVFCLKDLDSVWFIGIVLKDKIDDIKIVWLILIKLFDYDYSGLFCFLIGMFFFGGIVVVLWVLLCFRELYSLVYENSYIDDSIVNVSFFIFGIGFKVNLKSLLLFCWWNGGESDELCLLLCGLRDWILLIWKEIVCVMKNVLFYYWFIRGFKMFFYIMCIVGFVFLVGVF